MLKKILTASIVLALSCPSPASAMGVCYSACSWVTWGQREQVCASPSEGLWQDLWACIQRPDGDPLGGCATSCAGYIAGYDLCEATSDPSCFPGGAPVCGAPPDTCAYCVASACATQAAACSDDATQCVTCNAWVLGGYDPNMLCSHDPASIAPAVGLANCACDGACKQECHSACSHPCGWMYDGAQATNACELCLLKAAPKGCENEFVLCSSN